MEKHLALVRPLRLVESPAPNLTFTCYGLETVYIDPVHKPELRQIIKFSVRSNEDTTQEGTVEGEIVQLVRTKAII